MISHRLTDSGVLIVQPSGPLSQDDFTALAAEIDPWLKAGNQLKGLLIDAPEFPGWKNFSGLQSHLSFVRDHHRQIPRVAVVSDSGFLSALPKIGRHFINAQIRRFDAGDTELALGWLESLLEEPVPAIRSAWFPEEQLMWIAVDGKVTTDEYRKLVESMESILAETSPISFLVDIDNLDGVEAGAIFADLKFGLTHISKFRRIALVGDEKWIRKLASLPNPFSLEIKAFGDDEDHEAWDWIVS